MNQTRTIISFVNFREIEDDILKLLKAKKLNYGVSHAKGVTTILVNGKITREDLVDLDEYVVKLTFEAQDDPNDIVDCMAHNLSGLIDI